FQDEGDDVGIGLGRKASRAFRRHQLLDFRRQLADLHVPPEKREALSDEAGSVVVAAQVFAVACDTSLLIRHATTFRLRVGVYAVPHGTRRLIPGGAQDQTARRQQAAGDASRHCVDRGPVAAPPGSANTRIELPLLGRRISGASSGANSVDQLPPPMPAGTATYCLPFA